MAQFDPRLLKEVVTRIKNNDPRLYEAFLRLLDQHTWEVTVAVTEASSADILQAQGRAQEARKFMQLLSEFVIAPTAQPPTTP